MPVNSTVGGRGTTNLVPVGIMVVPLLHFKLPILRFESLTGRFLSITVSAKIGSFQDHSKFAHSNGSTANPHIVRGQVGASGGRRHFLLNRKERGKVVTAANKAAVVRVLDADF